MDTRLIDRYNEELKFLRDMVPEFAREFPGIARRLGMEKPEIDDPYVERLLEGFAFLTARIQHRMDARFPEFTQHLLDVLAPHYLAPLPAMAVVQLQPSAAVAANPDGFRVPRGTVLKSPMGKERETACTFRTAQDVHLLPIAVESAEYLAYARDWAVILDRVVDRAGERRLREAKAGLRVVIEATGGLTLDQLPLDAVSFFLRGTDELPVRLYEQIHAHAVGVLLRPARSKDAWFELLPRSAIRRQGFRDDEALLPAGHASFRGYRLLREYFAFPQRFLFAAIDGLRSAAGRCGASALDVVILFDRDEPMLQNVIDARALALFCTPAINLFPMRTDNVDVSRRQAEFHVVADRTKPLDYEIYQVDGVTGFSEGQEKGREFLPLYAVHERDADPARNAYYTLRREPRVLSERQKRTGDRTTYLGSELYVAVTDVAPPPGTGELRELGIQALVSNRDLPLLLAVGQGKTDFTLQAGGPVEAIRCVAGPSAPRPTHVFGAAAWKVISHLSLNYLSLVDDPQGRGAAALREMLQLYFPVEDAAMRKQVEGLRAVRSRPVVRRLSTPGPITFGRGVEIEITFEDAAFRGRGVFLLGAVLEEFLSRYVSINAFAETVLRTEERGEIARWPARTGTRPIL